MPSERRLGSRSMVQPPGYVWLGRDQEATILNVADDGIGILNSSAIESEHDVELRIMLGVNAGVLNTCGRVAWQSDSGGAGIHLPLQEWRDYLRRWRKPFEGPAVEQLIPPGSSSTLQSESQDWQTLDCINDERVLNELRADWLRGVESELAAERVRSVRIKYVAAVTLAVLICAATIWTSKGRSSRTSAATPPSAASETPQEMRSPAPATSLSVPTAQSPSVPLPSLVEGQSPAVLAEVLPGISYESGPNLARFFIALRQPFALRAVALSNPERIYFDVPTTAVWVKHKSVEMNNDFVQRIRVSQRSGGVTRVVLDLKRSCMYRAQGSVGSRHRVQIEVRPRSAQTASLHTKPLS